MAIAARRRTRRRGDRCRRRNVVLDAVGALTAFTAAGLVALRLLPRDVHRLQIAAEGSRDAALTVAPVAFALTAGRHRPGLALVVAGASLAARRTRPGRPARLDPVGLAPSTSLRLVTANLLFGNTRVEELGRQLLADRADVVVLQELTEDHVAGLRRSGLLDALPHQVLDPRPGYQGSAVLARWPLRDPTVLEVRGIFMATATIVGDTGPVQVVSVHVVNPAQRAMIDRWRAQLDGLADYVRSCDLPVVLAGDFNATLDHRGLRDLVRTGLVDAHDAAGRGLGLSWPRRSWSSGRWPTVPLMRLDHVLVTPGIAVRSLRERASVGSDHRRLVAGLGLPLLALPTAM